MTKRPAHAVGRVAVSVHVPSDDLAVIEAARSVTGESVSAFFREAALERAERIVQTEARHADA